MRNLAGKVPLERYSIDVRRYLIGLVLLALLGVPTPASPAAQTFVLKPGGAVFWNGPQVDGSGGSWEYRVEVTEPAYRLRIGIDHPEVGDVFEVEVIAPDGTPMGSFSPGDGLYSMEGIYKKPDSGVWLVRVSASDVEDTTFRMRAKVEAGPMKLGPKRKPLLPNLQVLPAHEASFRMPISNGSTPGEPIGIDLLGAASCHPEEYAEDRAVRCLRFGFGLRNTGLGPMSLRHEGGSMVADAMLFQVISRVNGTIFEREAGVARYHKTHAHYHHHDAVRLRLYKVTDPEKGTLEPTDSAHNKGFAHRDELLREWKTFYPTIDRPGGTFGLKPGWSDIYEWDRPGNYIDFGTNTEGHYLIRMWADPVNGILESNEKDNVGYTYFKVTGVSDVELLEAGRGRDPWDPCKIVVGFGGHPDPAPKSRRPAWCPEDTT